jgi:hypothetical protein
MQVKISQKHDAQVRAPTTVFVCFKYTETIYKSDTRPTWVTCIGYVFT